MATKITHTTLISSELFLGPKTSFFSHKALYRIRLNNEDEVECEKNRVFRSFVDIVAVCDIFTQLSTKQDAT